MLLLAAVTADSLCWSLRLSAATERLAVVLWRLQYIFWGVLTVVSCPLQLIAVAVAGPAVVVAVVVVAVIICHVVNVCNSNNNEVIAASMTATLLF